MRIIYKKQIFDQYRETKLDNGITVVDILNELDIPKEVYEYTQVRLNGELVHPMVWSCLKPKENAVTSVAIVPRGGGDAGELLKTAAVIAVAYYTGDITKGMKASAFIVGGATMAAGLALNALFPPPPLEITANPQRTSVSAITGQSNTADPYGVVLKNFGRNKIFPRIATEAFIYYVGDEQYLTAIYDFGLGKNILDEATLRIGESDLSQYSNVDYNIATTPEDLVIFKNNVNTESFNALFENLNDNTIRRSPINSESIDLKFFFQSGLGILSGSRQVLRELEINLSLQVRKEGSTVWNDFTAYDFEIDSAYETSSVSYRETFLKPDTIVSRYEVNLADLSTYELLDISHDSDVIDILTESVELRETQTLTDIFGGTFTTRSEINQRKLQVGDDIKTIGSNGGFSNDGSLIAREQYAKIVEVITYEENVDNENKYDRYVLRVNRNIKFNQTVSSNSGSIIFPQVTNYLVGTQARVLGSTINLSRATLDPFRFNVKINFNEAATWETRVYYESRKFEPSSRTTFVDNFVWEGIDGYTTDLPIRAKENHTYLEVKIKATNQLSGQIQNLSAELQSILPYYDDVTNQWLEKPTSNPAWVFADILTGNHNQRAISKDKLDVESLVRWAKYCEDNVVTYQQNESGFECNFVLDYSITVKELLSQVCSTGRATLNINNGKYGVIIDELKTVPTQIFNQRNIKSIKVSRQYNNIPDAVNVTYIDPASGWKKNQVVAYDDDQTLETAELIEEIEMFGTTDITQAWRQGRYHLAQFKLRQNRIVIEVDFENLACSRGDLVLFSHDVMKVGGLPSRVIAINNNVVTLDEPISNQGGSYVLRSRVRATDEIIDLPIISFTGTQSVEVSSISGLQYDDLVVFGEAETVTREYLVKTISYVNEFDASIELMEYAKEVYSADIGLIPDYTTVTQGDPLSGGVYPTAVSNLAVNYSVECNRNEKRYIYLVELTWDAPTNNPVDNYEIYSRVNGQQQLVGFTKNRSFVYTVSSLFLGVEHQFTVIGVDGAGRKMPLQNATSVNFVPIDDTKAPEDIAEFNANILSETIELDWRLVTDCDIDRYYIRYSPLTSGALWAQSVALSSAGPTQNTIQVPLRTGTYFIKAQDWAGNTSTTANFLITQVPEVLSIDFISNIIAPSWDGIFQDVELLGNSLKLSSNDNDQTFTNDIGEFFFDEIFDLGQVYTARFTSKILASGYSGTSIMSNWTTLDSIDPIAGTFTEDDFDVSAFIRTRNDANSIANWNTLSEVEYMSFGSELTATPWQRFKSADFTGRIFQLKVQLEGNNDLTVSPIVNSVSIEANWTDRIIDGRDQISGDRVVFDGAFVETPSIQVTSSENINIGDYYIMTEKDETGFTVQYFDINDIPISSPKFDWVAKGYGKKYTLQDINF